MQDNTARTIATLGVWAAVAVILTLGVFGTTWGDGYALLALVVVVAVICWAAAGATASIWEWKSKTSAPQSPDAANKSG